MFSKEIDSAKGFTASRADVSAFASMFYADMSGQIVFASKGSFTAGDVTLVFLFIRVGGQMSSQVQRTMEGFVAARVDTIEPTVFSSLEFGSLAWFLS